MSEIEKESLEAHVDLCAERYNGLHREISGLGKRMDKLEGMLTELRDMLTTLKTDRQQQLITWGLALIGALAAACGTLLFIVITS